MPARLAPTGAAFRQGWTPNTYYSFDDIVRVAGQSFTCIKAHTSTATFDGSKFGLSAAKGDYGVLFYIRDYAGVTPATVDSSGNTVPGVPYGLEDGVTDDTPAWTKLIAAITAKGSGTIMLTGNSVCAPNVIALGPYMSIMGTGCANSGIKWAFLNGGSVQGDWLVNASGPNQYNPAGFNTLTNFTLDGGQGGGTAPGLKMDYNAHTVVFNVRGTSLFHGFSDCAQLWDTRFIAIQTDYCGAIDGTFCMRFLNARVNGDVDTGNQNFIEHVRMEDYAGTALYIGRGADNTNNPNNYNVKSLKVESNVITPSGAASIILDTGTKSCTLEDIAITINRYANGATSGPAVDGLVNNGAGGNTLSRIRIAQGSVARIKTPFRQNATGVDHIADVQYAGDSNPPLPPTDNVLLNIMPGSVQPKRSGFIGPDFPQFPAIVGACPLLTASTTLRPSDTSVRVDATSGPVTITLAPSNYCSGEPITIVRVDGVTANAVVISGGVNSSSQATLGSAYASITLLPTDAGYMVTGQSGTVTLTGFATGFPGDADAAPTGLAAFTGYAGGVFTVDGGGNLVLPTANNSGGYLVNVGKRGDGVATWTYAPSTTRREVNLSKYVDGNNQFFFIISDDANVLFYKNVGGTGAVVGTINIGAGPLNSAASIGLRESGNGTVFTIQLNGVDTAATWTDTTTPQPGYVAVGVQGVPSAPYTSFSQVSSNKPLSS